MGKVVLLLTKMEDTASVTKFGNYQECSIEKLKFEMHFFFFYVGELQGAQERVLARDLKFGVVMMALIAMILDKYIKKMNVNRKEKRYRD